MMWLLPRLQPFSMQPYCHLLRLGGTARLCAPCAFRAISFTLVSHVLFIGGSSAISARCNCANASSSLFKELIKRRGGKGFMGFFPRPPSGSAASCHCRPQHCLLLTLSHAEQTFHTAAPILHIAHMRCLDFCLSSHWQLRLNGRSTAFLLLT